MPCSPTIQARYEYRLAIVGLKTTPPPMVPQGRGICKPLPLTLPTQAAPFGRIAWTGLTFVSVWVSGLRTGRQPLAGFTCKSSRRAPASEFSSPSVARQTQPALTSPASQAQKRKKARLAETGPPWCIFFLLYNSIQKQ